MKQVLIISVLFISGSLFPKLTPVAPELGIEGSGKDYTVSDRPGSNFTLDIISDGMEGSYQLFAATSSGMTVIKNAQSTVEDLEWQNSTVGYGGSSGIALDRDNNIWMTTATDTFLVDENVFLAMGTGVHFSPDSGQTWTSFPQPGITPIQGLAYDIACDTLGGVWMACWGQSLQASSDRGETWRTLTCDDREWDSFNIDNHKMFAVHFTGSDNLWVGTAEGINLCRQYNVPDQDRKWEHFTVSDGLTGHFTTAISSFTDPIDSLEYVFAATWTTEKPSGQYQGVSYTFNNGQTWQQALAGEKIFSFGFSGGDVYACGENGLWKSADKGRYWEKYNIRAWSELKGGYVDANEVYSFEYHNGVMFAGTGSGLAVSDDNGITWTLVEAYKPSSDSKNETYAYPNPFSPMKFGDTKLQFKLDRSSGVSCKIYNFAMEKVRTVTESKIFGAGDRYILWDGKDDFGKSVANGVYYYILSTDEGELWNKIIIFE